MGSKGLFDQLLSKGQELVKQKLASGGSHGSNQGNKSSSALGGLGSLGGLAAGGLSGAALMKLLGGSKKGGSSTGKTALLTAGSAAIGALAWKTYKEWSEKQSNPSQTIPSSADDLFASYAPSVDHDRLMLQAMIAAAKADGHIDERERNMIRSQAEDLGLSPELRQFITQELNSPLDPAKIASSVSSPEQAAELYLMSLLIVDDQNFMEKNYLQELARQLRLAPEMVARLEKQVQ